MNHFITIELVRHLQCQILHGELIDHQDPLKANVVGALMDEAIAPYKVSANRPKANARRIVQP
jgi:hypothetical protein